MKAVCKKLFSLMLVAILLVSAVPFQVSADETQETTAPTQATEATEATVVTETTEAIETTAATESNDVVVASQDTPALFAANPMPTGEILVYFQLEDGTQVGKTVTAAMSERVGSIPSASAAIEAYAKTHGNSDNKTFVKWYYEDVNGAAHTFNGSVYIHEDMAFENGNELNVYALIETEAKTIYFHGNGSGVSPNTLKVKIGEIYNALGTMPTPDPKEHYDFAYWVNEATGEPVNGNSIVKNYSQLKAHWTLKKYDVVFQAHNGSNWAPVDLFTFTGNYAVEANSTLKVADGYFPTDAQIKDMFKLSGWSIDGWEYTVDGGDTWKEFKVGSTKILGSTIIRPIYKRNITLYACDAGNTTRSLEVTLGKPFPILPHPGTREGYAFVGWYKEAAAQNLVSTKDHLSNVSKHPDVTADISALYAGWDHAKIVYLYIHTNGNTKEHTKLVRYYDVPVSGFDLTDIDLYDVFPNYGKYDDKGDEKWGWYNEAQWENFCMNKHKYETTEYVNADYLKSDDVHEFFIMLIDNGNNTTTNNSYNDNKNTVDSSNPTTGDDIFVAVTIMAVSACAVLLIFMNKKRFIK